MSKVDAFMPSGRRMLSRTYSGYGRPDAFATTWPRIAKPKFEYSKPDPGAVEKGMPPRIHANIVSAVWANCRSPHGLSSGNPSEWVSRWRIVITGESFVGYGSSAMAGT